MGDCDRVVAASVPTMAAKQNSDGIMSPPTGVLYRQLRQKPLNIVEGKGNFLLTDDGRAIFDATCGAAVSCLGHSDDRVHGAMLEQLQKVPYCYSLYFTNSAVERLSAKLIESTGGKMSRAFVVSSGMSALVARLRCPQLRLAKFNRY